MSVKDPVCGMDIDSAETTASMNYQGETYYFCCEGCQLKFEANPQGYLEERRQGTAGSHQH